LGGLKEEIRAPIILHRPLNLEAASTLTLLQEAKLEMAKSKVQSKSDLRDSSKFQSKYYLVSDKTRLKKDEAKLVDSLQTSNSTDKLQALKAYRQANNLCFTCGEKWTGHNHKCPTQIPLHIIQELMEVV
jgi:hypothetical protein